MLPLLLKYDLWFWAPYETWKTPRCISTTTEESVVGRLITHVIIPNVGAPEQVKSPVIVRFTSETDIGAEWRVRVRRTRRVDIHGVYPGASCFSHISNANRDRWSPQWASEKTSSAAARVRKPNEYVSRGVDGRVRLG